MRRLGALVLLVSMACSSGSPAAGVVQVSGPMPALAGELIGGGHLPAADLHKQFIVVNFWNPYCGPCRKEATALLRASRTLRAWGGVVVGVHYVGGDWPRSASAARAFLREFGITYPILEDPTSDLARAFGIQGIPTTIVTDEGGLVYRILGPVKPGQIEGLVGPLRPI